MKTIPDRLEPKCEAGRGSAVFLVVLAIVPCQKRLNIERPDHKR